MRILFINPSSEFKMPVLPLGMASVAAYLKNKEKNIEIAVIDAWAEDLGFEELENRIAKTKADIIGIYMLSPRYDRAKTTIEICRKVMPKAIIIAGGPHPSALPQETLKDIPQLDIAAIGEGEITMHELVQGKPLADIDGIAYREGQNIKITKPRDFIKDLDELPFAERELFPLDKYKAPPPWGRQNPYFTINTARGCPFQCAFCSKDVFKNNFRARSPKSVCDEIEKLISLHGAKELQFNDDDFTIDMKRAEEICHEIKRRHIKIRWSCLTRVDLITEPLLKKMKEAGCWAVIYGVESGNQKILDGINKGIKIEQIISAFKTTRKVGLVTICGFIVGLPGETKKTAEDTLDLIKKIEPDFVSGGIWMIYPGSRLFKLVQKGEYFGRLRSLDKNKNLPGVSFKGNYTILEDNLTYEEMGEIVKKMEREFYLRPQYVWQSLKSIRSFSDLGYYINAGLEMIKAFIR